MFKEIKYFIIGRLLSYPVFAFAYLYNATLKLEVENEKEWMDLFDQGKKIVFCAWHQQFLPVMNLFGKYGKKYQPGIMISRSRDGDIVANIAQYFGWRVMRGSSSKGGSEALKELIDHLKTRGVGAHILDGPRGPAGVIKNGIITLAHKADAYVVSIYVKPQSAWVFRSWDRMFLPKPFSTVKVIYDKPMHFKDSESEQVFETHRMELQTKMLPHMLYFNQERQQVSAH